MGRKQKVKTNWIDRAINAIAPIHGVARIKARAFMALADSYIAASRTRRPTSQWFTQNKSADSDLLPSINLLRSRSRDLVRNSPLACGAINTCVTNVVGTGLTLQSHIDRDVINMTDAQADAWERNTEREWRLWAESVECDAARTMTFTAYQDLVFRQVLENGDVFVLFPRISRKNIPYSLRLQAVEADRICNKDFVADTDELAGGVRKNETGAPAEYHILNCHPGNLYQMKDYEWRIIPAYGKNTGLRNVLHLFRILRPGQSRGIPYLTPVVEPLKQLTRYSEAEIDAAVISAMFTVFVKSDMPEGFSPMEPTSETGGASDDDDFKLSPGAILNLRPGEDIVSANPGRPNTAFEPFWVAIVRLIAVALEIPFETLIKHFTASYSASRAAMQEAWKFFISRRKWLADNFCQRVYEIWMYEAVATGRIKAPGYFTDPINQKAYLGSEWIGPAKGMINESVEVKAALERIDGKISTRQHETAQLMGQDWEKIMAQAIKEERLLASSFPKNNQNGEAI